MTNPTFNDPRVRQWQQQMKDRGWSIAVDSDYGDDSERICKAFQKEKGLKVDGIVGPITWKATWEAPVTAAAKH
ncbi:peptidoglycan-binding domain-containing protein [Actinoallomurus sp. CA-150999]|uniref:peptidoglycan-binding domain-containing protein n=1 Tax=Actinoallomurus sp. CA-150999 TaxID=3239887 RepID=UPI003D93F4B3